jgi:hypothetical protein
LTVRQQDHPLQALAGNIRQRIGAFFPATVQVGVAAGVNAGDGSALGHPVAQGYRRPEPPHAVVELHQRHRIGRPQLAQHVLGAALGFLKGATCHRAGAVDHHRKGLRRALRTAARRRVGRLDAH